VTILADTSVWVDHFLRGNARLAGLLDAGDVRSHPYVVGELAMGRWRDRPDVFRELSKLDEARVAAQREVMSLIERVPLWGCGIGWVDAHLIASALLDRLRLWTLDRRLAQVAREVGVGWPA